MKMSSLLKWLRPAAATTLLLLTAGACVPILPHDEYVPEMAGSKTVVERCWGARSVVYSMQGMTLEARIIKWPHGKLKLQMMLNTDDGTTLEWLAPDVSVANGTVTHAVRIPGISLTGNPDLKIEPLGPMTGKDALIYGQKHKRNFWIFVPMDEVIADEMRVTLPQMHIHEMHDGDSKVERVVTLPDITFRRQVRVQVAAPVQC